MNDNEKYEIIDTLKSKSIAGQNLEFKVTDSNKRVEHDMYQGSPGTSIDKNLDITYHAGETMCPSEFTISSNIRNRKDLIEDIIKQDNFLFLKLLLKSSTIFNKAIPIEDNLGEGCLSLSTLDSLQYSVEQHRLLVDTFIINKVLVDRNKDIFGIQSLDYDDKIYSSINDVNMFLYNPRKELPNEVMFAISSKNYLGFRVITDVVVDYTTVYVKGYMSIVNVRAVACAINKGYLNIHINKNMKDTKFNEGIR